MRIPVIFLAILLLLSTVMAGNVKNDESVGSGVMMGVSAPKFPS